MEIIYKLRVKAGDTPKLEDDVGSVLLNPDNKHCWKDEKLTILGYRKQFQDVLSNIKVINCEDDRFIALILDYFYTCSNSIRNTSKDETKHLMQQILADVMGGYLHVYLLPLLKDSYYAGNIKYHNVKKIFDLFDHFKNVLHTNGDGWRKPRLHKMNVKTSPLVIKPFKKQMTCDGLITYSTGNATCGERVIVPLPFLDENRNPNSIALPFTIDNLQSLYAEKSAFVLVKYYVATVKCIAHKSKTKDEIMEFQRDFFDWLKQIIHPRLKDEKWYPAFGGVLRIMSSLKQAGIQESYAKHVKKLISTDPSVAANILFNNTLESQRKKKGGESIYALGTMELIIIATTSALLVWLLIGLTIVCCRFLKHRYEESA